MLLSSGHYRTKPTIGISLNYTHHLTRGLVGAWWMNSGSGGKLLDVSLNRNHGTIVTPLPSNWVGSRFGGGYQFDGAATYANVGNPAILTTPNGLTIASWVKCTNPTSATTQIVFSKKQHRRRSIPPTS